MYAVAKFEYRTPHFYLAKDFKDEAEEKSIWETE